MKVFCWKAEFFPGVFPVGCILLVYDLRSNLEELNSLSSFSGIFVFKC